MELEGATKTIVLENGLHLIPGAPISLVVPVKARSLHPEERERLIAPVESPRSIKVEAATSVRPGLR